MSYNDLKIKVSDHDVDESQPKNWLSIPNSRNGIPYSVSNPDIQRLQKDYWDEKPKKDDNFFVSSAKGSILTLKSISPKRIRARTVLWYLAFCGFAVNYMIRITVNIAIVEMISQKNLANKNFHASECFSNTNNIVEVKNRSTFFAHDQIVSENSSNGYTASALRDHVITERSRYSPERNILQFLQIDFEKNGFHWNELEQSRVLGSFFWLHWVLQIPGGILGKRYGTKLVFGLSNFVGCLLNFMMPLAAYLDVNYLLILRILQGMITGLSWPAMHSMTAQWIPPNERSKFVTAYLGSSVGIAVFYPVFGYILAWLSWEWVFHISGIVGSIWYIAWLYFVYDTPAKHPRIDPHERIFIEKSLAGSVKNNREDKTPWKSILTSKPVWMIIIAQWGNIWGLFTLMTQAPTYFKLIHGWGVQMTGLLCGLPHLLRMIFAFCFSMFGDWLLRTERMTRTNVRKLAGTFCTILNGFFLIGLAFSGCNAAAAITFVALATAVQGAVSTGPLASIIDISPNYSGVILGLSSLITTWPGFISPYIVGKLTMGNQTIQQWQYVFLIAAFMLIGCGLLYLLFSESNLQSWNNSEETKPTEKELEMLNPKNGKRIVIEEKNQSLK